MARPVEDGTVENVYRLQLMNATGAPLQGRLAVQDRLGGTLLVDPVDTVALAAADTGAMVVRVRLPAERALAEAGHTLPVDFVIEVAQADGRRRSVRESSTFIVPR